MVMLLRWCSGGIVKLEIPQEVCGTKSGAKRVPSLAKEGWLRH
jgi:hypothetical protein